MMKVQVRLFAAARELVGEGQLVYELPGGATLQELVQDLFRLYPNLAEMRLRFAVNAVYVGQDAPLHDGDVVACIPPVGGG
jgi:molybdopterin converting factor subunit 1